MQDVAQQIKLKKSRLSALELERSGFVAQWQDVTRYVTPNNGRYTTGDRNRGTKKTSYIKDSTASKAHGILAAGLFGGNTSPAKPWFRMSVQGDAIQNSHNVKLWLDELTALMLRIFQQSNTYRALHAIYLELTAFGTAACLVMPDFQDVIRLYPLTAGEYCIGTDSRGMVNTLYRKFDQTASSMVEEFGIENVSDACARAFHEGNLDRWFTIVHAIEPRAQREYGSPKNTDMPFSSCYFELADKGAQNIYVRPVLNRSQRYALGGTRRAVISTARALSFSQWGISNSCSTSNYAKRNQSIIKPAHLCRCPRQ
jgi:hypothetical protein